MNSHHHTDDHDHDPIDDLDTLSPNVVGGADDALDDALLDLLGQAIDAGDPMPAHVLAAARGAVAWRTIDQDLAGLVFDSATELTGVRDPNVARQLTFRSDGVEIEVMLVDSNARRLVGQLVPARPTTVTLESTDVRTEQTSDRFGRFSFDRVRTGPVRFTVAGGVGSRDITTDWVLL